MSAGQRVYLQIPSSKEKIIILLKKRKRNKNKIYFAVGTQKKFLLQAGARRMDTQAPRAAADVWKCQYFKAASAVRTLSSDVWRRQSFVETWSCHRNRMHTRECRHSPLLGIKPAARPFQYLMCS